MECETKRSRFQGLVGAIFEGVGVSAGSFIGGILFEEVGGSRTFQIYGFSVLAFCVVHIGVQMLMQRFKVNGKDRRENTAVQADSADVDDKMKTVDLLMTGTGNVDGKAK